MSRVGNNPITIPSGVEVTPQGALFSIKGSKGTLSWEVPSEIEAKIEDGVMSFVPKAGTEKLNAETRAKWGLSRAMLANMVQGVSEGFEKKLLLKGVGYRANMQGKTLNLSLGFSHPVNMEVPEGLTVAVNDNTEIVVTGIDKQLVGQFAANVRAKRPVEPYKGKGIRYSDEFVVMKEGKKK